MRSSDAGFVEGGAGVVAAREWMEKNVRMRQGDRVEHPRFGEGILLARLPGGRARVRFAIDAGLPRTVSRRELGEDLPPARHAGNPRENGHGPVRTRRASAGAEARSATRAATAPSAPSDASASDASPRDASSDVSLSSDAAWQTLEALRLGVVPQESAQSYTVARNQELASVKELLEAARGCRIVWGDYGAGKTHLLDAAEALAFDRGFAVARITLDPREHALHHPQRLYARIAESLRLSQASGAGVEPLFESLLESAEHHAPQGRQASRFFTPYLHALRDGNEEAVSKLRAYVRGEEISSDEVNAALSRVRWRGERVLKLSDYRTYGRLYIHLVGTLAVWCRDAGRRGLVLLFDEVERIDALDSENRRLALEVLRHYAAVTLPREDLLFDPESLYRGGHEIHRRIPLCFRPEQPLTTLFALTPLVEIQLAIRKITRSRAHDIVLAPLTSADLRALFHRLVKVYRVAHPDWAPEASVLREILREVREVAEESEDSFRTLVRGTVYLLDAARLAPSRYLGGETGEQPPRAPKRASSSQRTRRGARR